MYWCEGDSEGSSDVMVSCAVCGVVNVQVKVPGLQERFYHSAAAFHLSPGMTEVTIFGGSEWPHKWLRSDLTLIANTTVLRFGEYTSCVCIVSYSHVVINFVGLVYVCPYFRASFVGGLHHACQLNMSSL